jgi:hypothetical protein
MNSETGLPGESAGEVFQKSNGTRKAWPVSREDSSYCWGNGGNERRVEVAVSVRCHMQAIEFDSGLSRPVLSIVRRKKPPAWHVVTVEAASARKRPRSEDILDGGGIVT